MLKLFYLKHCPFCKRALNYLEELRAEDPAIAALSIEMIEEEEEAEVANRYDYYYVPTFYWGEEKLHEGGIYKEELEELLRGVVDKEKNQ